MIEYEWHRVGDKYYYYSTDTGKIHGLASRLALAEIYFAVVYIGDFTYTISDEKHLGQYITLETAKSAIQKFWDIQNRTLLE